MKVTWLGGPDDGKTLEVPDNTTEVVIPDPNQPKLHTMQSTEWDTTIFKTISCPIKLNKFIVYPYNKINKPKK